MQDCMYLNRNLLNVELSNFNLVEFTKNMLPYLDLKFYERCYALFTSDTI